MSHNEDIYDKPDRFWPERFLQVASHGEDIEDPRNIVFGYGRRYVQCAINEAQINNKVSVSFQIVSWTSVRRHYPLSGYFQYLCDVEYRQGAGHGRKCHHPRCQIFLRLREVSLTHAVATHPSLCAQLASPSYPKEYKCAITPRSPLAVNIIADAVANMDV